MNNKFLSSIKRQKIKRQQEAELRTYMRTSLPVYNRDGIRRHRVPYYEAVLLELGEQGYLSSQEFLSQLIQYQERLRDEQGPDAPISLKPRLKTSVEKINILKSELMECEKAHLNGDIGREIDGLTKLSVYFGFESNDWWWLAEQVFIQAANMSLDFWKDGGQRQAVVKYIYGKFMLEKLQSWEEAKKLLIEARHISIGKQWTARTEMNLTQDTVFVECCNLLTIILLYQAEQIMKKDPLKAARICSIAEKRAIDACNRKSQAEALMLQAFCQMEAGDANTALKLLMDALVLYTGLKHKEGVCEARIHLALALLKIGMFDDAKKNLESLIEYAEAEHLPYYIGQAYRFLGELNLNRGDPQSATPLLLKAAQIFHEIDDAVNGEQAKNLAAVSTGQELMSKYVGLIMRCGKADIKGYESVMKLVRWKDTRETFWSELSDTVVSNVSVINSELQFIGDENQNEEETLEPQKSPNPSEEKIIKTVESDT